MGSETWRLELAPLGIRVITLLTGGVKTKFFNNMIDNTLPKDSYYSSIRTSIESLTDGRLQAKGMDVKVYATKVVAAVEKGSTGKVWIGADAPLAAFGLRFFPQFVMVSNPSTP